MHIRQNVSRLRNFRGIKQGDMAKRLKMTQQNYSLIENSENINDTVLEKIATELDYDVDFIKNFADAPYLYSNNQHGGQVINVNYEINPLEKIVALYEQLLDVERKKVALLEEKLRNIDEAQ
jgi:transcriptional regulator with XRE-family HTH domain